MDGWMVYPIKLPTWAARVVILILSVAAVTDTVTDQVITDTDVGVTLESVSTAKSL